MIDEVRREGEERMRKSTEVFRRDMAALRAGRASPNLLDKVTVDYYGAPTPVNQLATVSVPEPRMLLIQPWDKGAINLIERAIARSDLGITPQSDGNVIRLVMPQLTEERRTELVRQARKKAEEERVAIRNIRREANDLIKELEKSGEISEDDGRRAQEAIQKLTDRYITEIDGILEIKEREILEVQ